MLDTLKLKYFQGNQFIKDIPNAPMRDQFRGFPILKGGCAVDESVCPTGALKANPLSIDLGKCTLCGACRGKCIEFSNYYKLSADNRDKPIITEGMTPEEFEKAAIQSRKEIRRVFSKSLKLRQVSAAGCNGCEMELNACSNCNFDMGRFILAGACAISGGVFQDSSKLNREFLEKYPIDLYIPGCPIHPLTFINGVLDFISKK